VWLLKRSVVVVVAAVVVTVVIVVAVVVIVVAVVWHVSQALSRTSPWLRPCSVLQ
jgi:hypothetical protein